MQGGQDRGGKEQRKEGAKEEEGPGAHLKGKRVAKEPGKCRQRRCGETSFWDHQPCDPDIPYACTPARAPVPHLPTPNEPANSPLLMNHASHTSLMHEPGAPAHIPTRLLWGMRPRRPLRMTLKAPGSGGPRGNQYPIVTQLIAQRYMACTPSPPAHAS